MLTQSRVFQHGSTVFFNGLGYNLLDAGEVGLLPGANGRAWDIDLVEQQEGAVESEFSIPLASFHDGYGYTFAEIPNVYDHATGWRADSPGQFATWGEHARGGTAITDTDERGWPVFYGGYLYVLRGRYAGKYQPDGTDGGTWALLEYFDFETIASDRQVGGRPYIFDTALYVPLRNAARADQRWIRLTTMSTTTAEIQTIAISGTPTSGTYTVTFDGKTSAAIAYNADGPTLQAALRLIGGLQDVTVATAGSTPNFTHTVTLTHAPSALGTLSPPQMTSTDGTSGGTHAITHATTLAGVGDRWDQGPANKQTVAFRVWSNLLVRGSGNTVETCASGADPTVGANWGGTATVGDSAKPITDLAVYESDLIVGKTDGPWGFDTNHQAYQLLPKLSSVLDAYNCVGMEEADGYLLIPHATGLIRFRPGAHRYVGAVEDGALDGRLTPGFGRVSGIVVHGKTAYYTLNDLQNGKGTLAGFTPVVDRQSPRGPLVPHMYQQQASYMEGLAIVQVATQAPPTLYATAVTSDATVGSVTWTNPTNAELTDNVGATATTGTTKYLLATGYGNLIPTSATVTGIQVDVVKRKVVSSVTTSATSAGTGANFASIGTNAWTNPGNITASDNTYATCATAGTTQGLRASNFGFAIPATATILGVLVEWERNGPTGTTSTTYSYTGGQQTLVVPAGVTSLTVDLQGASSGGHRAGGGRVTGTLAVTPGETIYIFVGNDPGIDTITGGFNGGANGGANLSSGGGGRSDLRQGGNATSNIVAVAGGAGGRGGNATDQAGDGGAGGAATGGTGGNGVTPTAGHGGTGGTFSAGGTGGSGGGTGADGSNGAQYNGGAGGNNSGVSGNGSGGGGGGGWYGGGGGEGGQTGSEGGGGGGGSNYTGGLTGATSTQGFRFNDGQIIISYTSSVTDSTVKLIDDAGAVTGSNLSAGATWAATDQYDSFGGASNLWGATLTPAIVNNAAFGSVLSATVGAGRTASVDHCRITITYSIAGVVDNSVRLFRAGAPVGSNKASAAEWNLASYATVTYGSATDLWGTTWTAAQINAASFGIGLSATVSTGTADVDSMAITVTYTVVGVGSLDTYLVTIVVDSTKNTATPWAYHLPSDGMTAANDPQVSGLVGRVNLAEFYSSRYHTPGRQIQKTYRRCEFNLEASPQVNTPGLALYAKIDDGAEVALLDSTGAALVAVASGAYTGYLPSTTAAVGHWIQIVGRVAAVTGGQDPVRMRVRDLIVRGTYDAETIDRFTAYLDLSAAASIGTETSRRDALTMRGELLALRRRRLAGAPLTMQDPYGVAGFGRITSVKFIEKQFRGNAQPTIVALVRGRTTPYA